MAKGASSHSPKTSEMWLAEVKQQARGGDLFRAYDTALRGLEEHPHSLALQHQAILCLASTGATRQAAEKFAGLALERAGTTMLDPALRMDLATLKARLVKDDALAGTGEERRARLIEGADLYQAVFDEETAASNPEAYYPGINAASLNLLAGKYEAAAALAGTVLDHLALLPPERRDIDKWVLATEIEALLVLGRVEEARERIRAARRYFAASGEANLRDLASTLRQLRLIVAANGLDEALLGDLAPPRVIHYLGHIISAPGRQGRFLAEEEPHIAAAIEARISRMGIGFGYGSLAAGADLLFAEALLRRDASLHVVLPFNREEFIKVSVRPAGVGWVERFERCFAAAEAQGSVRFATEGPYRGDDALFSYCSQLAMGLAILRGRHMCAEVQQFAVWDGNPSSGPAGTATDMAIWRSTGRPQSVIPCIGGTVARAPSGVAAERPLIRRTRAMLFGDMRGFSRLSDAQLPAFVEAVLGTFAKVIDGYGSKVLLANTWGDGIYLVFDDAGMAAHCALALQDALAGVDLAAHGLPADMGLRIGGHLGPTYTGRDPILRRDNYFGAHVSRAARIEPVTPENCVYVTETLAAVLALHNADEFACDYVGMTEAAKHYGRMRMFLLHRGSG